MSTNLDQELERLKYENQKLLQTLKVYNNLFIVVGEYVDKNDGNNAKRYDALEYMIKILRKYISQHFPDLENAINKLADDEVRKAFNREKE